MKDRLLFALPKKGRLYEKITYHLNRADIRFRRHADIAQASNIPWLRLVFLPAKDIAFYVGKGEVDIGITGQDVVAESGVEVVSWLEYDFSNCKLCLQAPANKNLKPQQLVDKRIVTSFPKLTRAYFDRLSPGHKTEIRTVAGSVEVACQLGLADGVVDLVETGDTMKAAGLAIIDLIMETKPVLISNPLSPRQEYIKSLVKRLEGIAIAELYAMIEYNIPKSNLSSGEELTPGQQSPTVIPLEDSSWVAVRALVLKSEVQNLLDALPQVGASSILVYNLDNYRS